MAAPSGAGAGAGAASGSPGAGEGAGQGQQGQNPNASQAKDARQAQGQGQGQGQGMGQEEEENQNHIFMRHAPHGPTVDKQEKVRSFVQMIQAVFRRFRTFMLEFKLNLIYAKQFGIAVAVLAVLGLIASLFMIIYIWYYPRICLINRTADFESYIQNFYEETERIVFAMHPADGNSGLDDPNLELLMHVGEDDERVLKCDNPQQKCDPKTKKTPGVTLSPGGGRSSRCVLKQPMDILRKSVDKLASRGREQFVKDLKTYSTYYSTIRDLELHNFHDFIGVLLKEKKKMEKEGKGDAPVLAPLNAKPQFLRPVHSYFARKDILNEPRFEHNGEIRWLDLMEFRGSFFVPFNDMCVAVRKISKITSQWCALYHQDWYNDSMFAFLMQIYLLDLSLNGYHAQRTRSFETRRNLNFGLQFNVWYLYFAPYAERAFKYRIPKLWMSFPDRFVWAVTVVADGWAEKGGKWLSELPCKIASIALGWSKRRTNDCLNRTGGDENKKPEVKMGQPIQQTPEMRDKLRDARKHFEYEGFLQDDGDDNDGGTHTEEEEQTEGFGSTIKGLKAVGDFFRTIFSIAKGMVTLLRLFRNDPFRAIFAPILLIFGLIHATMFMILHTILTAIMFHYLLGAVWGIIYALVFLIVWTVLEVVFLILVALLYVGIWLADLATGGLMVKLMRCEVRPDEWEMRGNFAEGNSAVRIFGTACCYPCGQRYRPQAGVLCEKNPHYLPALCPQQQIIQAYRHGEVDTSSGPFMFDKYPVNFRFRAMKKQEKIKTIANSFDRAKQFMGKCIDRLNMYDFLNRHICASLDNLPEQKYGKEIKDKLRALCFQAFCDYKISYKDGGPRYDVSLRSQREKDSICLCSTLDNRDGKEEFQMNTAIASRSTQKITMLSLMIFVGVLVGLVSVYTLLTTIDSFMRAKFEDSNRMFEFTFSPRLNRGEMN